MFSPARLRKTWNCVRTELRKRGLRDALDWLDWVHAVDGSLEQLRGDVIAGVFQPRTPARYEIAKSKGSYRVMTQPCVRDLLVYRHLCGEVLDAAIPYKVKGAYFSMRHACTPVGPQFDGDNLDPSSQFYAVWLRYNEYRTLTLLNSPYCLLVSSDISNYFDSVQHDLLLEYLAPFALPRKAIATLGRILEAFKPSSGHSPNPRVGLAVDEFDCSRQLAHVFLYEHDHRMIAEFGETNYVRWMDDQNIGVRTTSEARRAVNRLTRSLMEQRLTLNTGKTQFMTPDEVVRLFHLDTNKRLTEWEERWKRAGRQPLGAGADLRKIWNDAEHKREGHWGKVLKRFYGCVIRTGDSWLDGDAHTHLSEHPELDERIFRSLALRGKVSALIKLFRSYVSDGESLYDGTEAAFFDMLLLSDASGRDEDACLELADDYITGRLHSSVPKPLGVAAAVICHYWFGGSSKRLLDSITDLRPDCTPSVSCRAMLATLFALNLRRYDSFVSRCTTHPSDDVGRLCQFLSTVRSGTLARAIGFASLKLKWPLRRRYYDARAWLCLDVLSRNANRAAIAQLRGRLSSFSNHAQNWQEKRVLERVTLRLGRTAPPPQPADSKRKANGDTR